MLLASTILAASLCAKAPAIIDEVVQARDAGTSPVVLMFKVRNSDNSASVKFWLNQTIHMMYMPAATTDAMKKGAIVDSCGTAGKYRETEVNINVTVKVVK